METMKIQAESVQLSCARACGLVSHAAAYSRLEICQGLQY
jgi:hypothetical protein